MRVILPVALSLLALVLVLNERADRSGKSEGVTEIQLFACGKRMSPASFGDQGVQDTITAGPYFLLGTRTQRGLRLASLGPSASPSSTE